MTDHESREFDRRRALKGAADDLRARQTSPTGLPPLTELQELFAEFEIEGLIGRGGMGAVYRAHDHKLDRPVAIKILPPELAADPAFEERFQREARTLARLSHPHIVRVQDFGQRGDLHYLITDFVDGVDLRRLLDMGQLPADEVLRIIPAICDALQYAHDAGVVHRDIKPENILVDQSGHVFVADFGLAKIVHPDARDLTLTGSHQALGTPHYMAPEQMRRGGDVDHRADLFSMGVLLYEMLTGHLPVGHFDPPSRSAKAPKRLDEVVRRTLSQDADARYQSATELKQAVQNEPGTPSQAEARQPGSPQPSRLCTTPLWGLALVFAIAILAFLSRIAWGTNMARKAVHESELQRWEMERARAQAVGVEFTLEPPQDPDLLPIPTLALPVMASILLAVALALTLSGVLAIRRIRAARGRLHGLLLAVLCAWGPLLIALDAGIIAALDAAFGHSNNADLILAFLGVPLIVALDTVVVAKQVEHHRRAMRATA